MRVRVVGGPDEDVDIFEVALVEPVCDFFVGEAGRLELVAGFDEGLRVRNEFLERAELFAKVLPACFEIAAFLPRRDLVDEVRKTARL